MKCRKIACLILALLLFALSGCSTAQTAASSVQITDMTGRSVSLPLDKSCKLYTLEGKIKNLPHFYEKHESVASLGDGAITFAK